MKYYYLSKAKLINEEIQVLKTSGFSLSDENADALFGIGSWICYFGPKLPARMKYDTTTNKIVVLTDDAPKQHLYAGVSLLKGVVTEDKFDPSMFVNTNDLNFLVPLKFGGTPAFTYPHKSYFMTFKADGTPVSELMRVLNDEYIQLTPSNIDALIKRHLRVEGNISAKGNIAANGTITTPSDVLAAGRSLIDTNNKVNRLDRYILTNGTITTPSDVLAAGRSLIDTNNKVNRLENYVYNMKDVVPPGVIGMFHTNYIPYGWTVCDGRAVAVVPQTELYRKYIGSATPDMRGYFVRGWDGGSGRNSGRGPNSYQTDAGRNITGSFGGAVEEGGFADGAFYLNGMRSGGPGSHEDYTVSMDASRVWGSDHTANEFRPMNYSVIYAIKTHETARSISDSDFLQELYGILAAYKVNKSGDSITGHVMANGNVTYTGSLTAGTIYYVGYNDYAEWFESDIKKPNHVYAFMKDDKYKLALQHDKVIAGVYSTSCIDPIGNPENAVPIALMGRVKVITDGIIEIGDLVTVSDKKPGHIVKFGGSGEIIGVALTDTRNELTKILVI